MTPLEPFIHVPRIAYFSMEIALRSEIPTYAGGLGVLAGDTLRAAADLELPLVGVLPISRRGYFRQILDGEGRQTEQPEPWSPEQWTVPLEAKIAVPIESHKVWVQAWLYVLEGGGGYRVPVILLDTDLAENSTEDRAITDHLYGGDDAYRLKQEIVLGIGGARILQALGFTIHTYHMNEGHSAMLALELLWRSARTEGRENDAPPVYDPEEVRDMCLFTTHTPIEAGHDQFGYELVWRILDRFIDVNEIKRLAGAERLNMTRLAMNLSGYVNGVARSHALTANHLFPGYRIHAITNGVHGPTWTCPSIARLFDTHVPRWRHEPELLVRSDLLPDEDVWAAHREAKRSLIDEVHAQTGRQLDINALILGFARRMTAYKRPDLLFTDVQRLQAIATAQPLQIVMAGKAHPRDAAGKAIIEALHRHSHDLESVVQTAFLPNYSMATALSMVSGVDVWLNTPLPPLEASGTSGMKASFNGVLNLGVLDGWWLEGCIEGVTGWAVGTGTTDSRNSDDAVSLYDKLENTVLPLYYGERKAWIAMMKQAIAKNAYYFNSHRMMRRYATEAYIR